VVRAYDLASGHLVAETAQLGGGIYGLVVGQGRLYALDSGSVLHVFDIAGGQLIERGSVAVPYAVGGELYVADGVLYLPTSDGFNGGYVTLDVSDPNAPVLISGPDATNIGGDGIALNGSGRGVVVGNPGGVFGTNVLDVVNTADPTDTGDFLTRVNLPQAPKGIALSNGFAFVADGTGGLLVVNYQPRDTAGVAPVITLDTAALDIDPATAGIQVLEGAVLALAATVTDDAEVSEVEVLLNGTPVALDGSYPFDLAAAMPTLASGATSVRLQLRATDIGGNVGLSQEVTLLLSPDIVGPELLSSNLVDGDLVGRNFRALRLGFDEPLDQAAVTGEAFQLHRGDVAIAVTGLVFRDGGRSLQVLFDTLEPGAYSLTIDRDAVVDGAGNAMGATPLVLSFEVGNFEAALFGTLGNDTLDGTPLDDRLDGGTRANPDGDAGWDMLRGGAGADTLIGRGGFDHLYGGVGNDRLEDGADGAYLYGEDGDDRIVVTNTGGAIYTANQAWGGTGNDTIGATGDGLGGSWGVTFHGEAGHDSLAGTTTADNLQGGTENDTLAGGEGDDALYGGEGSDAFYFAFASGGGDWLYDYVAADDTFLVSASGFGGGLSASLDLFATGRYVENADGTSTAAAGVGQIVFRTNDATLWWDVDGVGNAEAVLIARLGYATGWSGTEILVGA
jgi:Ca2+-binding RTX toxin-like protein